MSLIHIVFVLLTILSNFFLPLPMLSQVPIVPFKDESIAQLLGKKVDSLANNNKVEGVITPDLQLRFSGFVLDGKISFQNPILGFDSSLISSVLFHMDSNGVINTLYFDLKPKDPDLIHKLMKRWGKPFSEMKIGGEGLIENLMQSNYAWKLYSYNVLYLQGMFPDANLLIIKDDSKTFVSY